MWGTPTHDGVVNLCWAVLFAVLFDVLNPILVLLEVVGRKTNELHTTSLKVTGAAGDLAELGGANWGKVICGRAPISSGRPGAVMKSYQGERREWPV